MRIDPILEESAPPQIRAQYDLLKKALDTQTLPLFFTYLGPFPEYLEFISEQLVDNLRDSTFQKMIQATGSDFVHKIHNILKPSEDVSEWLEKYRNTPTIYHFKNDLQKIYLTNIKLAFIFISLREAVKGWAIAAKRLSEQSNKFTQQQSTLTPEDFIFEKDIDHFSQQQHQSSLVKKSQSLSKSPDSTLEYHLLPRYLKMCSLDFKKHQKHDYFWILRVHLEEMVLAQLAHLPSLIFSPYNVIVTLTRKYDNFPDLLFLLSESFPTYTMQRLMFSGFILI